MNVTIDGVRYVPAADPGLLDYVCSFPDAGGFMPIRDYLRELLIKVWDEGERFNGKRPFGNSGWAYDLYTALISAGAVDGEIDEEGCLVEIDGENESKANAIIFSLIREMCAPRQAVAP